MDEMKAVIEEVLEESIRVKRRYKWIAEFPVLLKT